MFIFKTKMKKMFQTDLKRDSKKEPDFLLEPAKLGS